MAEKTTRIYTDESCHLGTDSPIMVFGATWCSPAAASWLAENVKLVKMRHDIPASREIKWTKVSNAKIDYYKELVDLFVQNDDLHFRAVVVPKEKLDHERFGDSPDDFYYKMQYLLIRNIANKNAGKLRIFLDYKDSWSNSRAVSLSKYLLNTLVLSGSEFEAQPVRSHEVVALQFADLLLGVVTYANRNLDESDAKKELVEYVESRIGQKVTVKTPFGINKFNLFFWEPRS